MISMKDVFYPTISSMSCMPVAAKYGTSSQPISLAVAAKGNRQFRLAGKKELNCGNRAGSWSCIRRDRRQAPPTCRQSICWLQLKTTCQLQKYAFECFKVAI